MKAKGSHFPSRRSFLFRALYFGAFISIFSRANVASASVAEWYHKIRGHLMPTPEIPPEGQREFIGLPAGGEQVPLETALNSRCSSDSDDDSNYFHYGMFDYRKKLSAEDVQRVLAAAKTPKLTAGVADLALSGNVLRFFVETNPGNSEADWQMVASGLQQQAVCLVCAALGAGMKFQNMGKDGKKQGDGKVVTIQMKIDAMKPSYAGSFWTTQSPGDPWLKGNLPEPERKGNRSLLQALAGLKTEHAGKAAVSEKSLGQVLWAARGRTPHLYKSRQWGMTIPSWEGEQNYSGLFLLRAGSLYQYVNQTEGKPTHALEPVQVLQPDRFREVERAFHAPGGVLVFARRERFAMAFWQVGYMFLNALLQASTLDLSYRGLLLDEAQKTLLESAGIGTPVAAMVLG
jgi:hypothetical protein